MTLVLLPGLNGTQDLFAELFAIIGDRFQYKCVEYPDDEKLGYKELEFLVSESLPMDGPFVIVGESFSGPIAISIAEKSPTGLVGLVLCCSFVRNPRPSLASLSWVPSLVPLNAVPQTILGRVLLGRAFSAELSRSIVVAIRRIPSKVLRARLREITLIDVSKKLTRLALPVLSLVGTRDLMVSVDASNLLRRCNSSIEVVEIEAPHFLLQTAPKEAFLAIQSFMRRFA